jgi:hypothetical protein
VLVTTLAPLAAIAALAGAGSGKLSAPKTVKVGATITATAEDGRSR